MRTQPPPGWCVFLFLSCFLVCLVFFFLAAKPSVVPRLPLLPYNYDLSHLSIYGPTKVLGPCLPHDILNQPLTLHSAALPPFFFLASFSFLCLVRQLNLSLVLLEPERSRLALQL